MMPISGVKKSERQSIVIKVDLHTMACPVTRAESPLWRWGVGEDDPTGIFFVLRQTRVLINVRVGPLNDLKWKGHTENVFVAYGGGDQWVSLSRVNAQVCND